MTDDDFYKDYDARTRAAIEADKEARKALEAKGKLDPRLTSKLTTVEHYDAIRAYDSDLARELVKILNKNNPSEIPNSSKPSYTDKRSAQVMDFARKPYAD